MHFHNKMTRLKIRAFRKFYQYISLTLYVLDLFTFIYFILLDYLECKVLVGSLFLGKFDNSKVPLAE